MNVYLTLNFQLTYLFRMLANCAGLQGFILSKKHLSLATFELKAFIRRPLSRSK
jgi:hypothetical protein